MTISTTSTFVRVAGNGVTTVVSFPFKVFSAGDLTVRDILDSTGTPTTLTLTTHYSVALSANGEGGTVTFVSALAAGHTYDIRSNVPETQGEDIRNQGRFLPEIHEGVFDKTVRMVQDLARKVGQTISAPDYEASPPNFTLPNAVQRANNFVAFNSLGDVVVSSGTGGGDAALRNDLANTTTAGKGNDLISYRRTAAEIAAGVTPVNYAFAPLHLYRYGENTVPGTTDMTSAFTAALAVANAAGGGEIFVPAGVHLIGTINWPGNNITLRGAGCGFSYETIGAPVTVLKAKAATTIILDLVLTGTAVDITGCLICDLMIDGAAIAAVGIDVSVANIIERVTVKGCTSAAIRVPSFVNQTQIRSCNLTNNSGWGLVANSPTNTIFSIIGCVIGQNTLGGINIEGASHVYVGSTVIESNLGPGLRIYRPSSNTNALTNFTFQDVWFEDNASTAPNYTVVLGADTGDPTYGPQRVIFRDCHFSPSNNARKYLNANVCQIVRFEACNFANTTATDALTLSVNAREVAWIDSAIGYGPGISAGTGLTATQLDNAIAQGAHCYSSDRSITRVVGAGSPAAAFTNSWVNFGGGFQPAQYWFDRDGVVHLAGSVKTGSAGTSVFTLPVGYRPAAQCAFAVNANGAFGLVYVNTNGTVVVNTGSSTITSLDGISFATI